MQIFRPPILAKEHSPALGCLKNKMRKIANFAPEWLGRLTPLRETIFNYWHHSSTAGLLPGLASKFAS